MPATRPRKAAKNPAQRNLVRRRRATGNLAQLKVEVWATICFLSDTVADTEQSMEHRLKAAAGMMVGSGVFRNILEDCRQEKLRELLVRAERHDALDTRMDEDESLDAEIEEPSWTAACEQAMCRGTFHELQQSLALHGLPPPNKALVQAESLARRGQAPPPPAEVVEPVNHGPHTPPAQEVHARPLAPVVRPPDPEELRLMALEEEVRGLVDGLKAKVRTTA